MKVRVVKMKVLRESTISALESAFDTFRLARGEASWIDSHLTDSGDGLVLIILYSE